ncbi:MAG: multicopper oxidase domain-containing protein [Candidatus Competibacteraceae bacterium]|nr:multicopper oxidase domain-containing protein [Candidatus Competibacteraceae bacterium]MCB1812803.1 multicopper oxidase domain-containing protein [Candidatus Competibacteraceae bacterium]
MSIVKVITPLLAGLVFAMPVWAELRQFEMTIEEVEMDVAPGFKAKVWAYDGQVPGPLLRVNEGDEVEVTVYNLTTLNHTVHWHGVYQTNTWRSDGVPNVTQLAIQPGDSYTYRFVAEKVGTLWYHCHVNVSEHVGLRGMWGPFIVDPKEPVAIEKKVTKEAILMFSGWNSDVANTYGEGGHPGEIINYFSINGRSFPTTQPLRVKKGDVLRIRLIAATLPVAFHLHGHDMLVTHKDGLPLSNPYPADVVNMGPGERYDVIVEMNNPGLWMTHDHIEHHTTNNGKEHGGSMLVVEYEGIEPDDWYPWKDKPHEADFYYSESMAKGPGLFDVDVHRGKELPME